MKEKAKEIVEKQKSQQLAEINSMKKVHQNLLKLTTYQRKLIDKSSGISTPAVRLRPPNARRAKNVTIAQEEQDEACVEKEVTPNKALFEMSEASLNISGKPTNRHTLGCPPHRQPQHPARADPHEISLYDESRLTSIQTLEWEQQQQMAARNSALRGGRASQTSQLGVCFERSASNKHVRNQARRSQSPSDLPSKKVKRRPASALSAHQATKAGKKSRSVGKRPKSVLGRKKFNLPARGRLTVKMPLQTSGIKSDKNSNMTLDIKLSDDTAAIII